MSNIKTKAIKSFKWTALGEIVPRSITPIATIILARILTPADFGLLSVAMIVIGFVQIFRDVGLGYALVQRNEEVEESSNIVFWTSFTLSVILYLVIFIAAPLISIFFKQPEAKSICRLLSLQIILGGLISAQQALFQREFQFKQLFFIRLLSAVVPGIVSIPLALTGYGVWSLVFGSIAGCVGQVFLVWRASPWRPQLRYDFQLARKLLGFGGWVTLEALMGWMMVWGDSVILGHYLGVKELGVYRLGVTFVALTSGIIVNPIVPIIYSSFSRLQSEHLLLKNYFLKSTKLVAVFALPIGIGIVLLAQPISSVLFGAKWKGLATVLMIIGIKDTITSIVGGINVELLRAAGRPDISVKAFILSAMIFIPIYIFAAPYGLLVFCLGRLLVSVITGLLFLYATMKIINVSFSYPLTCVWKQLLAASFMGIIIYIINNLLTSPSLLKLTFIVTVGCICYLGSLWIIDKNTFKLSVNTARAALSF